MSIFKKVMILIGVLVVINSSTAGALEVKDLIPMGVTYLASGTDECGQALASKVEEEGYKETLYTELTGIAEEYITDEEFVKAIELLKQYALARLTFRVEERKVVVEQAKDMSVAKMNTIPDSKEIYDSLDVPAECKVKVIDVLGVDYNQEELIWERG